MAKRQKSAEDITDTVMDTISEIRPAAIRETREGLADRIAYLGKGTVKSNAELAACLTDPVNRPDFKVTAEFLAGLRFAAELIADPNFDL